jgi:hypothetical protein
MRSSQIRSFLMGALAVGLIAFGSGGTYSAFFSKTSSPGNRFEAGTVHLVDDDGGSVMFNLSGMRPSDPARARCMTVTYNGSLNAEVRLYGTISSSGVEPYVNLKVETGTTTSGYGDCSGFTPSSTLYDGTMSAYPTGWSSGIADPGNPWTTGEAHTYRFTVSIQNNPAAQGGTAAATFAWEARSL